MYQHNNSDTNSYTSKYRPWELVALYQTNDKSYIKKCERFIKRQKSKLFIQKLIKAEVLNGVLAQLVRVPNIRD